MGKHGAAPPLPVDAHRLYVPVLRRQPVGTDRDLLPAAQGDHRMIIPGAGQVVQVLPRIGEEAHGREDVPRAHGPGIIVSGRAVHGEQIPQLVEAVGDEPRLPGVSEQVGGQKRRFVAVIHQPGLDAVDKAADEGILPAAFLNEGRHIVGHEVGNAS